MLLKISDPQTLLKLKLVSNWPTNVTQINPQTLLKLTHKCYSKLLKIFENVIQTDPQALLKTNFKDVTKLKNLFANTAQLKPQTK